MREIREKRENPKSKISEYKKNTNIIKYFFIILMFGSICGSISCNYTNIFYTSQISSLVENFFSIREDKSSIIAIIISFIENFFKNSKYFIFIWFLGFISSKSPINYLKYIFIYFIIFIKGVFIGFTSSIIISQYNFWAISYIFKNYILSSIIFIITNLYTAYIAIKFTKKDLVLYIKKLFYIVIFNFIMSFIIIIL